MDDKRIEEFLTFVTHMSYSAAAKECFVSPTTLSTHIADLEKEIGTPLVAKRPEGFSLTPAGSQFVREGKTILACIEQARQRCADAAANVAQLFYVSGGITRLDATIFEAINRYALANPQKRIDLVPIGSFEQGPVALRKHAANLAGYATYTTRPDEQLDLGADVAAIHLWSEDVYFCMERAHPLFGRQSLSLSDIEGTTLVFANLPSWAENRARMEAALATLGVDARCDTIHANSLIEYLLAPDPTALKPVIREVVDSSGIVDGLLRKAVPLANCPLQYSVYLIYDRCRATRPLLDLLELL